MLARGRHLRIIFLGEDIPLEFVQMHHSGAVAREPGGGEDLVGDEGCPDGFSGWFLSIYLFIYLFF